MEGPFDKMDFKQAWANNSTMHCYSSKTWMWASIELTWLVTWAILLLVPELLKFKASTLWLGLDSAKDSILYYLPCKWLSSRDPDLLKFDFKQSIKSVNWKMMRSQTLHFFNFWGGLFSNQDITWKFRWGRICCVFWLASGAFGTQKLFKTLFGGRF